MGDAMNINLPKRDRERWFFARFCAAAGLEPVEGSIEQPEEDPPDLRVQVRGHEGPTAFELVRLNDPDDLRAKKRGASGDQLFKASFAALDTSRSAALKSKFKNCAVTISFSGTEPDTARGNALTFLWRLLEELPAQHDGPVRLKLFGAPTALTSLWITHTPFESDGPRLQTFS